MNDSEILALQQKSHTQKKTIDRLTKEIGEFEALNVALCCTMIHFVDGQYIDDARSSFTDALKACEKSPNDHTIDEMKRSFRHLLGLVSKELARRLSLKSRHAFPDKVRDLATEAYLLKSITRVEA